jgi:hypothetical protein
VVRDGGEGSEIRTRIGEMVGRMKEKEKRFADWAKPAEEKRW